MTRKVADSYCLGRTLPHVLQLHRLGLGLLGADDDHVRESRAVGVAQALAKIARLGVEHCRDACFPKRAGDFDAVAELLVSERDDHSVRRALLIGLDDADLTERVEQTRQPDRDAHTGKIGLGVVASQVVVPATRTHTPDLRVVIELGLVHSAGVVVETADDLEVELEPRFGDPHVAQSAHEDLESGQAVFERLGRDAEFAKTCKNLIVGAFDGGELEELFDLSSVESNTGQFLDEFVATDLLYAVDGVQHVGRLVLDAEVFEQAVEDEPVADTDRELTEAELLEDLVDDRRELRVNHRALRADDVDVTLVELAEATSLGTFGAVNLADVIAPERERQVVLVLGHVSCEWDSQVVAQRQVRVGTFTLETVDLLFGLPATLGEQDFRQLDVRGVEW